MTDGAAKAGAAARDMREITIRGVLLGAAITVVFISANLYLGLKTGLTFASSIPAATISMSVLTLMGGVGILENNIVQTQASAAGTLCNVLLAIPGLVLVQYWHGFPLWQTTLLCLLGGLFGVAYSVPLRRVLVVHSKLPFPEGVAAAEVLRCAPAHGTDGGDGIRLLGWSTATAATFSLCTSGLRLFPEQIVGTTQVGQAVFRAGGSLSLAMVGAGYLVRIGACLALLVGVFIAWGVAVPVLTGMQAARTEDAAAAANAVWTGQVRLIGAGVIAVAGLWTVATLVKPMVDAFRPADPEARGTDRTDDRAHRDIPIPLVGLAILGLSLATAVLFASFAAGSPFASIMIPFVASVVVLTTVFGFFLAAACGYMAGLLGSSSSPISGIGILATLLVAVCLTLATAGRDQAGTTQFVAAFTLFVVSFIVTSCSIANDNLQDLKTGLMIGATPWKQQVALAIGVAIGAVVVAPVLDLLYNAYGFADAMPRAGMSPANAMSAPQAALMAQIARGIVEHHLNWTMVTIGGALGLVFVGLEWWLGRRGFSFPAMTVGIGIYLPISVVFTIALGGVLGWLTERTITRRAAPRQEDEAQDASRRRGVLVASGFFVGESLFGVMLAGSDMLAKKSGSLAFAEKLQGVPLEVAGALIFGLALAGFHAVVTRSGREMSARPL